MPTICLTAAHSITASVNPPRAAFVDLPLGNTAGRPNDPEFQRDLLRRAFAAAESMDAPGTIADLGVTWDADGSWKRFATSTGLGSGDSDKPKGGEMVAISRLSSMMAPNQTGSQPNALTMGK